MGELTEWFEQRMGDGDRELEAMHGDGEASPPNPLWETAKQSQGEGEDGMEHDDG